MVNWIAKASEWIELIYKELKVRLLQGDYIQADETRLKVQDGTVKGRMNSSYLWPYTDKEIIVFDYCEGRGGGFSHEERERLRKERASEILEKIKTILENPGKVILLQSNTGKAISHALKNWKHIVRYVDNGKLEIDNNFIENQIRPVARETNAIPPYHSTSLNGTPLATLILIKIIFY